MVFAYYSREVKNPWIYLPDAPPYVLDTDADAIRNFNANANERHRVATELLPEPFVGRLDAPIFMLLLNPGIEGSEFVVHHDPDFFQAVRACYRQDPSDYPQYFLAPKAKGPGVSWNRRVLKPLITEFGLRAVSANVTLLEYFPYHSVAFAHHKLHVPSQEFGFHVLREAIKRDSVIFVTRGFRIWEAAVPELGRYRRAFRTRSVQNVVISARNCPDGYAEGWSVLNAVKNP
jgi:hypothetical protein